MKLRRSVLSRSNRLGTKVGDRKGMIAERGGGKVRCM